MSTDITFITNEQDRSLLERFKVLIKDTQFFDVLVGYFYTSGFHALYKSLEKSEKIRILIGISTDRKTYDLIEGSREPKQLAIEFSHTETKEEFARMTAHEMEWQAKDDPKVEEGIHIFMDWLRSGKMEIHAYPSERIHSKLYIMTFAEGDRDKGRVITGSSNFTKAGLLDNLEFNVELKTRSDYDYAKDKFEELWKDSVNVSEKYIETIQGNTWLNDAITPYELYLKFLYEYFKEEINRTSEVFYQYVPAEFKKLEYQEQAVLNAEKILEEYGGVFLSDVVGLGKTYMAAMLAQQLDGRSLVIAPPMLLDEENPGSWSNVFDDFKVHAVFESIGMLDKILERGTEKYKNVFIDEAHRFRTDSNVTYEKLSRICRGKRVILVSATPYNNKPRDILSQIKLFQKPKNSTIPNLPNLDAFFLRLERNLKNLDRQIDHDEYLRVVKGNAKDVREKVLKYLMVRRTRKEIEKYFADDLKRQKLRFPDVSKPEAVFYEFDDNEDVVFSKTIELVSRKCTYARYMPLSSRYYKGDENILEEQAQINMGKLMKILLVKRLESSFFAFRNSIERFIRSYERFIVEYENGAVYVSRKHSNKLFDYLEEGDDAAVQKLIDEEKAEKFKAGDFKPALINDLQNDLAILRQIEEMWKSIVRDPKLLKFTKLLTTTELLTKNKIIVFTESKETAEYLAKHLNQSLEGGVLCFTGGSHASAREEVIQNFDAKARHKKDDYRVLVTTEVLSEGVNLHRSNVVFNYDIPWNPTRIMQRVGRINRVDTKFSEIHTFNFFPTKQSNDQIKLKESAESKIHAFIEMLGNDAKLLTEGEEVKSHDLFARLSSKQAITGEEDGEESELKYLNVIRIIRDEQTDLFDRIKRLPKKARTARTTDQIKKSLLTYFRKGKLQKFFLVGKSEAEELDFITAASYLETDKDAKRQKVGRDYHDLLGRNKEAFRFTTSEELEIMETKGKSGRDSAARLLKIMKARNIREFKGYTEEDEEYLKNVIRELQEGGLPKQTLKQVMKLMDREMKGGIHPLKILAVLRTGIPAELFAATLVSTAANTAGPREVILSEYFTE